MYLTTADQSLYFSLTVGKDYYVSLATTRLFKRTCYEGLLGIFHFHFLPSPSNSPFLNRKIGQYPINVQCYPPLILDVFGACATKSKDVKAAMVEGHLTDSALMLEITDLSQTTVNVNFYFNI